MTQEELREILRRDVVAAGPALLGAFLVRGSMRARIVEVEAYRSDDPACHAFERRTPRTEVMYGPPGFSYVYFNYGVHWMLNIVAHEKEDPAALLIRAAEPLDGLDQMARNRGVHGHRSLLSGPGKLAKAFGITGKDNGIDLLSPESHDLRIVAPDVPVCSVFAGPRIGLAAGKWEDVPWRFVDGEAVDWASRRI
ncbi:MAG: DNA-3-methyladenine glycosylase [Fimbriimonas sp.]|nr:DNA-3-methyladenine glycosylase [Fimbriimonas sp.]